MTREEHTAKKEGGNLLLALLVPFNLSSLIWGYSISMNKFSL